MSKLPEELLKHILDEANFRSQHKEIEWKQIAGMRDRLVHEYFSVDYELVWDVIENEIPHLKEEVGRLLNQIGNSSS